MQLVPEKDVGEDHRSLVNSLDYVELHCLRALITERMNEMRETGITQLKATISEQATLLGIDLKDLIPRTKRQYKKRDKPDPNLE